MKAFLSNAGAGGDAASAAAAQQQLAALAGRAEGGEERERREQSAADAGDELAQPIQSGRQCFSEIRFPEKPTVLVGSGLTFVADIYLA